MSELRLRPPKENCLGDEAGMGREIAKAYEPQQIEPRWAEFWVKEALFKADASAPGPVFSIVIPPPNVTGSLHIGHMLDHTEIDILTRWHRMRGYNTLYLAGDGPRGNFDTAGDGEAIVAPGDSLPGPGAGRVHQARVAVEGRERRNDPATDEADWGVVRLVAGEVYAVAGIVASGAGSIRAAV